MTRLYRQIRQWCPPCGGGLIDGGDGAEYEGLRFKARLILGGGEWSEKSDTRIGANILAYKLQKLD